MCSRPHAIPAAIRGGPKQFVGPRSGVRRPPDAVAAARRNEAACRCGNAAAAAVQFQSVCCSSLKPWRARRSTVRCCRRLQQAGWYVQLCATLAAHWQWALCAAPCCARRSLAVRFVCGSKLNSPLAGALALSSSRPLVLAPSPLPLALSHPLPPLQSVVVGLVLSQSARMPVLDSLAWTAREDFRPVAAVILLRAPHEGVAGEARLHHSPICLHLL